SRRRHTRFSRDWSSDVCSSDLSQAHAARDAWRGLETGTLRLGASTTPASYLLPSLVADFRRRFPSVSLHLSDGNTRQIVERLPRSEERRVGKGCGARGATVP